MDYLQLITDVEDYANEKGLDKEDTTITELIGSLATELSNS